MPCNYVNSDVFALPGRLTDPASQGTNRLIRKGAVLVTTPEDILEHLGPVELPSRTQVASVIAPSLFPDAVPNGLGEVEGKIWDCLGGDGLAIESILERTGLEPGAVTSTLLVMEIQRYVDRLPGGFFRRRAQKV